MWLKLTRKDSRDKELVNMATCCNVAPLASGGVELYWFGCDSDTTIEFEEDIEEIAVVLGAVGKP